MRKRHVGRPVVGGGVARDGTTTDVVVAKREDSIKLI